MVQETAGGGLPADALSISKQQSEVRECDLVERYEKY